MTYQAREGHHVASSHGIVVSLDLTVTEELKEEGYARELVRNIQDARKQMGCRITDRILVSFRGKVPEKWLTEILSETLAVPGEVEAPDQVVEMELDEGRSVTVKIAALRPSAIPRDGGGPRP